MRIEHGKTIGVLVIALSLAGLILVSEPAAVLGQDPVVTVRKKPTEDYHLGAGDMIRVVVWKNEELSGDFRIRPDGKFSMPLIGDVLAEDSTTDGVSMQIEQKLKLFIESPYVSTIVIEAASNRYYILGEVINPGSYAILGPLTALQAIAMAGGFTQYANKEKIVLVRGAGDMQENIPLSYSRMLRDPGGKNNPVLNRGDTLVVP